MTTKFKLIAASLAAPLAIGLAAPAAAQQGGWDRHDSRDYRGDYNSGHRQGGARQIERKLEQLRVDIRQAQRSGQLTRAERYSVRGRLEAAERAYVAFARNGITRQDVRTVNWRIDQAYDTLRLALSQGNSRYDRYDDYDDDDRRRDWR